MKSQTFIDPLFERKYIYELPLESPGIYRPSFNLQAFFDLIDPTGVNTLRTPEINEHTK